MLLTKHIFRNIVDKVENDIGDNHVLYPYEDFLLFTDKLYDALWEHLKDCDDIEE